MTSAEAALSISLHRADVAGALDADGVAYITDLLREVDAGILAQADAEQSAAAMFEASECHLSDEAVAKLVRGAVDEMRNCERREDVRSLPGCLPASRSHSPTGSASVGDSWLACLESQWRVRESAAESCAGRHAAGRVSGDECEDARIGALREAVAPAGLSDRDLANVLQAHGGDAELAAGWLLDKGGAPGAIATLARRRGSVDDAAPNAADAEAARRALVAKYGLRPEASGGGSAPAPAPDARGTRATDSQVRYRDGVPVSQKGEKYVVQAVPGEWDGGSRGKVYTKGKRGKGFH